MKRLIKALYRYRIFYILINHCYNFYITSSLFNPQLRGLKRKRLKNELDFFIDKILKNENFALVRNGDGERAIMQGRAIVAQENWASPDYISKLGRDLLESLNVNDERFYYAISCPCCDREAYFWYKSRISNPNITFANLWVNINFRSFKGAFERIKRPCVLIANHRAKILLSQGGKLGNMEILKHYEISDDCITFWEDSAPQMIEQIKVDFGESENLLFVVSAGPMSMAIIKELFLHNPNNAYVDFGSSIDSYYTPTQTRPYQDKHSIYGSRNCYLPLGLNTDVSVVLTLYKRGDVLEEQVRAILGQSIKPKELILFVDSTKTSPLGMQCDRLREFQAQTDHKSSLCLKFPQSSHSHTTNARSLDSENGNLESNKSVESSLRESKANEAIQNQISIQVDCHDSANAESSNENNTESSDLQNRNKINLHEVQQPQEASSGVRERVVREGEGSDFAIQAPLPPFDKNNRNEVAEQVKKCENEAERKIEPNGLPRSLMTSRNDKQGLDSRNKEQNLDFRNDNNITDSRILDSTNHKSNNLDSKNSTDSTNHKSNNLDSKNSTDSTNQNDKTPIDSELDKLPKDLLDKFDNIISPKYNVGVWGRFAGGLLTKSEFVCFFDDDTIPAHRWIENCFWENMKQEGLYGGIGILSNNLNDYPFSNFRRVGWDKKGNNSKTKRVDFVGHSWFLRKNYLGAMWLGSNEFYKMRRVGEDAYLSFALRKFCGIETFVPPHKDLAFFSSTKGMEYGTNKEVAISQDMANYYKMNEALKLLKKSGMKEVSFSIKVALKHFSKKTIKYFIKDKATLEKIKQKFKQ